MSLNIHYNSQMDNTVIDGNLPISMKILHNYTKGNKGKHISDIFNEIQYVKTELFHMCGRARPCHAGIWSGWLSLPRYLTELSKQKLSELVAHEEVEDGVDDAVHEGQGSGQDVQAPHAHPRAELHSCPRLPGRYGNVPQHVVRSVENQKHGRR